jgi:mono/diheme cytochrome c family protein
MDSIEQPKEELPAKAFCQGVRVAVLGTVLTLLCAGMFSTSWAETAGEKEFNTACIVCHTIGKGRLVGPDLAGVTDRRPNEWLIDFIKSSQSMIKAGDPDAVALVGEYAGMVMPDTMMSDQQIADIVNYLRLAKSPAVANADGNGLTSSASNTASTVAPQPVSEEEITAGQHYFEGKARFENGGAACNACHDVQNDSVIGGGVLAAELTTVFSRMGGSGVRAILGQAPFPVMQVAYDNKPLTEKEVTSLVAFLEFADSQEYNQLPMDDGVGLFLTGTVGGGLLLVLFAVVWRGRKVGSVNQAIYDRQIQSQLDDGSE